MTGNNRPQKWEVWFADVQFDDGTESKKRPVVVLDDKIGKLSIKDFIAIKAKTQDFT